MDWPHWPGRSGRPRRGRLEQQLLGAEAAGHLLFAAGSRGYFLLERAGEAPPPGARVSVGDRRYVVVRVAAAPLPGDARRCCFAEQDGSA